MLRDIKRLFVILREHRELKSELYIAKMCYSCVENDTDEAKRRNVAKLVRILTLNVKESKQVIDMLTIKILVKFIAVLVAILYFAWLFGGV